VCFDSSWSKSTCSSSLIFLNTSTLGPKTELYFLNIVLRRLFSLFSLVGKALFFTSDASYFSMDALIGLQKVFCSKV